MSGFAREARVLVVVCAVFGAIFGAAVWTLNAAGAAEVAVAAGAGGVLGLGGGALAVRRGASLADLPPKGASRSRAVLAAFALGLLVLLRGVLLWVVLPGAAVVWLAGWTGALLLRRRRPRWATVSWWFDAWLVFVLNTALGRPLGAGYGRPRIGEPPRWRVRPLGDLA